MIKLMSPYDCRMILEPLLLTSTLSMLQLTLVVPKVSQEVSCLNQMILLQLLHHHYPYFLIFADASQHISHVLSPVLEDVTPLATFNTASPVEVSHSTDDSPPIRKDTCMGEEGQFLGEDNAAVLSIGSEDTVSDQGVEEETSKLVETDPCGNSNFNTVVIPETTPPIPTPSELELLKQNDPLSFLKTMTTIDSTSILTSEASPTVQTKSGHKEDISSLLRQIKEKF